MIARAFWCVVYLLGAVSVAVVVGGWVVGMVHAGW